MAKPDSLQSLYLDEIKDLYDAENRIVKALPKLAEASTNPMLRDAFNEHLQVSRGHVKRLETIFADLGEKASGKTCNGIKGIIDEGSDALDYDAGSMKDAALIGGAQRVEHYEIAAYGTARTWAEHLGRTADVQLLDQTLQEEKEADRKLTAIAEGNNVNEEARETPKLTH
jgi:ferritin-like metal-binding protein YciE